MKSESERLDVKCLINYLRLFSFDNEILSLVNLVEIQTVIYYILWKIPSIPILRDTLNMQTLRYAKQKFNLFINQKLCILCSSPDQFMRKHTKLFCILGKS